MISLLIREFLSAFGYGKNLISANLKTLKHMNIKFQKGLYSDWMRINKLSVGFVFGFFFAAYGVFNDAAATPVIINNASFETLPPSGLPNSDPPCFYSFGPIPDWSSSADSGQVILNGYNGNPASIDGSYLAWAEGSGSIWQDVGTAVAGTAYTLNVDILHRSEYAMGGVISLNIGGTEVATGIGADNGVGTWNNWTATYTATDEDAGKTVTIVLSHNGSIGSQADFDNVRLDAAAVPEPATVSFLGIGGLGMAIVRFARRRKSESVA